MIGFRAVACALLKARRSIFISDIDKYIHELYVLVYLTCEELNCKEAVRNAAQWLIARHFHETTIVRH